MITSTITTRPALEQSSLGRRHDWLIDRVNAARAGDKDAWNALVDRFLPLVTSVIAKYRLQPSDAADVNQTVWLRLVEHLDDLRELRALPGWLATTARNESLRVIRLRGRDTPVDPQWAPWERPDQRPDDNDLIREERAIALREALLELAPQNRELLRLLMVDPPVSYDQISVMLGISRALLRRLLLRRLARAPLGRRGGSRAEARVVRLGRGVGDAGVVPESIGSAGPVGVWSSMSQPPGAGRAARLARRGSLHGTKSARLCSPARCASSTRVHRRAKGAGGGGGKGGAGAHPGWVRPLGLD